MSHVRCHSSDQSKVQHSDLTGVVRGGHPPVGVWLATKIVLKGARAHVAGDGVPLHLPAPVTFLVKINAAWHRDLIVTIIYKVSEGRKSLDLEGDTSGLSKGS